MTDLVTVERCLTGRLSRTYPASAHDVELRPTGSLAPERLTTTLASATRNVLTDDPRCRRVVFAPATDDWDAVAAAEKAGFRHVVDVDLPGAQLSLLVFEPGWVTAMDSDRVPGT